MPQNSEASLQKSSAIVASATGTSPSDVLRAFAFPEWKDHALDQLRPNTWLGNESIQMILEALQPSDFISKEITMPGAGQSWEDWAKKKGRLSCKNASRLFVTLYIPTRRHFVLLYFNLLNRHVTLYDPLRTQFIDRCENAAQAIITRLGLSWADGWHFERDTTSVQQNNTNDCGLYCLVYAVHLIAEGKLPHDVDSALWRSLFGCLLGQPVQPETVLPIQSREIEEPASGLHVQHRRARVALREFSAKLHSAQAVVRVLGDLQFCHSKNIRQARDVLHASASNFTRRQQAWQAHRDASAELRQEDDEQTTALLEKLMENTKARVQLEEAQLKVKEARQGLVLETWHGARVVQECVEQAVSECEEQFRSVDEELDQVRQYIDSLEDEES